MEKLLYMQLVDQISQQIRDGMFKVGERLPSVRKLSQREQVSIATVNTAYANLEQRGWIEARPKSGYFVRRSSLDTVDLPSKSKITGRPKPVNINELAMEVQRGSSIKTGSSFCAAVPDINFPISKIIQRTFVSQARMGKTFGEGYDTPEGNAELRHQVAKRALEAGIKLKSDDLITTAGAQNALALALRAMTVPGDIVAVESPCYFGLLQMIESFGLKAVEVPADPKEGISIDALKLALQQWPIKAVVSIPAFSNPLGCSISDEHKKALIGLLQQYDIAMIEDDIYGELNFEGRRPKAVKAFDDDGRVLWCSSVSKTMEPQLRVGWIAPGRYYDKILHQKYVNSISNPSLAQSVVAQVMEQGQYERHLRQAREAYRQRSQHLLDLAMIHFPSEMRASSPKGGLVTWFEMPKSIDATQLYHYCREQGVRIAPGELFSISGLYQHCFRMSHAKPWTTQSEQAVGLIGQQLKKMLLQSN
ncbi:PLP-dependent aminotransferase family protein [Marinicellulosiphila megalodicopiae]|uniref:aminotransferase-like domain-containing protein n=1 Tax=Marinicellulosiphila megalodicopiae TaxID=2724896 RepID=UPI003BAF5C3E